MISKNGGGPTSHIPAHESIVTVAPFPLQAAIHNGFSGFNRFVHSRGLLQIEAKVYHLSVTPVKRTLTYLDLKFLLLIIHRVI